MSTYYTLTFSENSKGWPSFYSFKPEMMVGMNNYFYSFKRGSLWRHNSDNVPRMRFYGITESPPVQATLTSVINERPLMSKLFKTLELNSTNPWRADLITDIPNEGYVTPSDWEKKEGDYFSYIRSSGAEPNAGMDSEQRKQRSVGGIGQVDTIALDPLICPDCYVVTYLTPIPPMVSVGDAFYDGGNLSGTIKEINSITQVGSDPVFSPNTIVFEQATALAPIPGVGGFTVYAKSIIAESHGLLGHYLEFTLSTAAVSVNELFAVKSDYMKSFP